MKMTQFSRDRRSCARRGKLAAAFTLFLAACSPIPGFAQESTARLSALTPSVFQGTSSAGTLPAANNGLTPAVQNPVLRPQVALHQPTVAPAVATTPAPVSPAAGTAATTSQIRNLQYISGEQLTQKLVAGLGDKLDASVDNGIVRIKLPSRKVVPLQTGALLPMAPASQDCEMLIDRSNHRYAFRGDMQAAAGWQRLVGTLDSLEGKLGSLQLMLCNGIPGQELPQRLQAAGASFRALAPMVYQVSWQVAGSPIAAVAFQEEAGNEAAAQPPQENAEGTEQLTTTPDVKLTISEDGTALIIEGTPEEIARFQEFYAQLAEINEQSKPTFDTQVLQNANNQELAPVLQQLYDQSFAPRLGAANISAVPGENALVISGRKEAIDEIKRLVERLDIPSDATGAFKVLRPQYISAVSASNRLANFFNTSAQQPGNTQGNLNAQNVQPILLIPDPRSNSIIIKGSQTQLVQAQALLKEIDIVSAEDLPMQEVKIIGLRNSVAADMAQVIQSAINGQVTGAPTATTFGNNNPFGQFNQNALGQGQDPTPASTGLRLKLMTIDEQTGVIKSGILLDVQITADPTSNSLVVRGPAESLPLVEELIAQLDRLPNAESKIKVFTIQNGDAEQLYNMLGELFQSNQQQSGGFGGFGQQNTGLTRLPLQTGATVQTLVNLRFTLEPRTNSIIASGSDGDLMVVEDLLTLLDRESAGRFRTEMVRLSNLPAEDVSIALNEWLASREDLFGTDPTTSQDNPYVFAKQRIVVTPEPISNTLIVTASPENLLEVLQQIRVLDRRPPMVQIKVMIAEVTLNDTEEFGLQFGVQDSILFDRGLAGGIGYNFNQAGIGNSLDATGLASRELLAGQGLVNLGVGRTNQTLGYGGLVLSAGNESIAVLLRALKDKQRLRTLSNPVLMTIDNLQARVQVGQKVPYVTGVSQNTLGGFNNQVTLQDVGVILDVVPRVSPDGMITMLVNAQNSSIGSETNGTAIAVDASGNTVRQAPINITLAVTTVLARSGQTVVLGGLIRDQKTYAKRGVPILSDLPRVGPLFSFQSENEVRTELLFFLTPTLVEDDTELACTNQAEMDRMHWCLEDVVDIHGPIGVTDQGSFYNDSAPVVVYPDVTPTGPGLPAVLSRGQGVQEVPVPAQYQMMESHGMINENCGPLVPNAQVPNLNGTPMDSSAGQ